MDPCQRHILPNVKDFKAFWKDKGPFCYALTANDYPPQLLEPEEWIFGNDPVLVLKELMQFSQNKMSFVKAPFNPKNTSILRPEDICQWRISHFPEEWNSIACQAYAPEGYLSMAVIKEVEAMGLDEDKAGVEKAFFSLLEKNMGEMGYTLIVPRGKSRFASIRAYVEEWEEDDADAGLI